ncbi:MAG: DNA-methyltransferase [Desulfovibrionaceae bacterium]
MALDKHTILLGDCREKIKIIEDASVDIIITDPPYFLDGLDGNWNGSDVDRKRNKAGIVGGLPVGMKFNTKQGKNFQKFYYGVSQELYRVLKPGGFFLSFSQPRLFHRMAVAVEDAGFEIRDQYVWKYGQSQMKAFSQNHFVEKMAISDVEKKRIIEELAGRKTPQLRPQFESILLAQKPKEGTFVQNWLKWGVGLVDTKQTLDGKTPTTIMKMDKAQKDEYNTHLTVKPVRLLEHLIQLFSQNGQVVLDPFLGSGSTIIASYNTDRICIGIEIQEEYYNVAKKRSTQMGIEYLVRD